MDKKPYLIGAVIGNSRLLAGLGENGQLQRLFWPRIDTSQNIYRNWIGLFIDNSLEICWLHEETWQSRQHYVGDTNILVTVLTHKGWQLEVTLTDFAIPGEDLLVRQLAVANLSSKEKKIKVMLYSDMMIGEYRRYHTTIYHEESEALWQFKKDSHFLLGADQRVDSFQCGDVIRNVCSDTLNLKPHAMSSDGAISWDMGMIGSGESTAMVLYASIAHSVEEAQERLFQARQLGYKKLEGICSNFWHEYLNLATPVTTGIDKLDALYRRSLLVFHLMTDAQYGSIMAAPEVDEDFTLCGGYSYCWGRDAAYIIYAIDRAGLTQAARKFYRWAIKAQNSDGSWEQRHYLDGTIAPNWGLQIDETGSIIWGMWQHYRLNNDLEALKEFWPSIKAGTEFLVKFMDVKTGLPQPSMDLWEERCGEHTYSAVAVWAGVKAASEAAHVLGYLLQAEIWLDFSSKLRNTIEQRLWNEQQQCFLRGIYPQEDSLTEDAIVDISLLGLSYPFDFLAPDDPRMTATALAVEKKLSSPKTGGLKRYEDDQYIGGNPWILSTLWLALYYVKCGNNGKAGQLLDWAAEHQTHVGLLPEQIDKETGNPAWIIPLTWSHAMLVLTILELYKDNVNSVNETV